MNFFEMLLARMHQQIEREREQQDRRRVTHRRPNTSVIAKRRAQNKVARAARRRNRGAVKR